MIYTAIFLSELPDEWVSLVKQAVQVNKKFRFLTKWTSY